MFLELIATFCAGLGAAGVALLLRRVTGGVLPGWLTPVAAGTGMIAFAIWSEYSWYGRTTAALPDGVEVTSVNEARQAFRPWTYIVPMTDRFIAVDTATARTNPELPGQRLVDVYLMGRWSPNYRISMVLDCDGNRRADLVEGVALTDAGRVPDTAWRPVPADDPLLAKTCAAEVEG